MKNLVKIAAVAVLSLGFGVAAQAQNVSVTNTSVTARAEVLAALNFVKDVDPNFGSIAANTPGDVFLDPQDIASTNVGTTAAQGKFTLTAAASKSVRFGWPASIVLNNGNSGENMTFTLAVSGLDADTQGSSADLTLSSGVVDVSTSGTGKYFLWVGGSLGRLTNQPLGIYTGVAEFTVEYN